MSRIGKMPIPIPAGVGIKVENSIVTVEGPKGKLTQHLNPDMKVVVEDSVVRVERPTDSKLHRALHGLSRSLVANMVEGVTNGYTRRLVITGVGYRVQKQGNDLVLQVGFSHPVEVTPMEGIELNVEGNNRIIVQGIDKQRVGEMAANIRAILPPEPYKGKGIAYEGERIRRKAGKAGKVGK
ncbi:MAG: 50S ribosomal protein L6 [bacterium]|jgi:large subunit ribosomal protein L6|nr:50S ribosomal protein L6 [bacterium]MDD3805374.1 50S ribosomal protein L6 [bacterium]MDD4152417.1 50S ribosomal protein L6 [bacterium]MDD4558358.1 50S ribosomal protein L6 [bacterium]